MAVNEETPQGPATIRAGQGYAAEKSAALAPLEEQHSRAAGVDPAPTGGPPKGDGGTVVVVDGHGSKAPRGLATEEEFNLWRPPPVVLVIAAVFLAFIAFVAWQIYRMPAG
jgi:hypothetical protein